MHLLLNSVLFFNVGDTNIETAWLHNSGKQEKNCLLYILILCSCLSPAGPYVCAPDFYQRYYVWVKLNVHQKLNSGLFNHLPKFFCCNKEDIFQKKTVTIHNFHFQLIPPLLTVSLFLDFSNKLLLTFQVFYERKDCFCLLILVFARAFLAICCLLRPLLELTFLPHLSRCN